jgi:hypothetical protein
LLQVYKNGRVERLNYSGSDRVTYQTDVVAINHWNIINDSIIKFIGKEYIINIQNPNFISFKNSKKKIDLKVSVEQSSKIDTTITINLKNLL